jgi:hypothetical protein
MSAPELILARADADALASLSEELGSIERAEKALLDDSVLRSRLDAALPSELRKEAAALWAASDHVVVRGLPPTRDGSSALLLAALLFRELRPYRENRIVKHFHMSPWTTALSHTLAEGSFHTDLNTAAQPPAATLMQCVTPDPDAPRHGQLRVARFRDVLSSLEDSGADGARRLLTEEDVVMVNDASAEHWSGRIHYGKTVRFHPETLRAGHRRHGVAPPDLEASLQAVHDAAMAVSSPINLDAGESLIVSNRRAMHQRGACTVRFRSFPRDFESRSVAVMHAMDDLE